MVKDTSEKPVENAVDGEKPKQKKKKRTALSYAVEFFVKIAVSAVCIWALCSYVIAVRVNHNNASYPMIKDGDLCICYRLGTVKEGDVIAYKHDRETCFGRVVAFEGETVEIKNGGVSVDGYGIYENVVYETTEQGSKIKYPYSVPEKSYFVLNDFREDVNDSRVYGGIPVDDKQGKIIFIMRRRGF